MLQLADTLGSDLTDEVEREFVDAMKTVPMGGRKIWNTELTKGERVRVINQGLTDVFASRTEDGQVFANTDPTNADELTLTQFKVTISMEVTEMTEEFDKQGLVPQLLSNATGIGTSNVLELELIV